MVRMLSASSVAPYMPDIPMQPSPSRNTSGPVEPSVTVRCAFVDSFVVMVCLSSSANITVRHIEIQ